MAEVIRCRWANLLNPLYVEYHDREWGVPCHDETRLFELLNLEGAQAGLSWSTILNKRENYRLAFDQWDAKAIAGYGPEKVAALLENPGIVRNKLKIAAAIQNANAYLDLVEECGGLDTYLWKFNDGTPIQNHWSDKSPVPATSELSDTIAKDLKQRGFKFVGSTIVYAYLQACGLVNDHVVACFRHDELAPIG